MPYVFNLSLHAPIIISGTLVGWKEKVAGRIKLGELNGAFIAGNLWLDETVMPDRLVIEKSDLNE